MSRGMPNPTAWTIRFKNHKSTTLLHVDPLQDFTAITTELLHSLKITHPSGQLHGYTIPSDPHEVLLAKPNDIYDASQGWTRVRSSPPINTDDDLVDEEDEPQKKKLGPGKKKKAVEASEFCPKAAGLRDGSVLAFKFRAMVDESLGDEDDQWDVVIPTYEDIAGSINEGDVGGMPSFTG